MTAITFVSLKATHGIKSVPQVTSHIECVVGFDMKGVVTSFQWVQVGKEGVVAKVEGLGVIVGGLEVCL